MTEKWSLLKSDLCGCHERKLYTWRRFIENCKLFIYGRGWGWDSKPNCSNFKVLPILFCFILGGDMEHFHLETALMLKISVYYDFIFNFFIKKKYWTFQKENALYMKSLQFGATKTQANNCCCKIVYFSLM